MAKNSILTRTVASVVFGATGLLGFTSAASAQTSEVCIDASFGGATMLNPNTPRTPTVAIELPAGQVSIPIAHSWDAYDSRINVNQAHEIWEVEFIGSDGSVVGVSAPTPDIADMVVEAHWRGSLGTVTLSAPAVGIRAHHLPASNSMNSVHASEIRLCYQQTIATTTTTPSPSTTAPPPSGPTITGPPAACPVDGDGIPVDPTDPDCPTTTTTPACELDGDGIPVDATDPDCPTTTTAPPPKGPTITTAPPPKGPTLPVTGSESTLFLLGGLWFMTAGSTMVAFSRNR